MTDQAPVDDIGVSGRESQTIAGVSKTSIALELYQIQPFPL